MSIIHISYKAYDELKTALINEGHELDVLNGYSNSSSQLQIPLKALKLPVSEPVNAHPDIFLCKLGSSPKSPVFHGDQARLGTVYPQDVLYNAVVTERFMICNTKTVSAELIEKAREIYPGIQIIHVPQGYTKCNTVVVDEDHFITEDEGIFRAISEYNTREGDNDYRKAECLLIRTGHVLLPGYKKGFIGGTSGRIGNQIWFNGDLRQHPDFEMINSFISGCGLKIKFIPGRKLTDIGSIIEDET